MVKDGKNVFEITFVAVTFYYFVYISLFLVIRARVVVCLFVIV